MSPEKIAEQLEINAKRRHDAELQRHNADRIYAERLAALDEDRLRLQDLCRHAETKRGETCAICGKNL